jgi:hypothetical protein
MWKTVWNLGSRTEFIPFCQYANGMNSVVLLGERDEFRSTWIVR